MKLTREDFASLNVNLKDNVILLILYWRRQFCFTKFTLQKMILFYNLTL